MPSLDDINKLEVETIEMPLLNGETLSLKVQLGRLTGEFVVNAANVTTDAGVHRYLAEQLALVTTEWNATEPVPDNPDDPNSATHEEILPITVDNVLKFGVVMVGKLYDKIGETLNPPKPKEGSFNSGSRLRAN